MSSAAQRPTRVRHTVLALVVMVYFITYLDRVLLSNALPVIQKEFGFSIASMGLILGCYQWAYALFQIPGGWFGDRVGPRIALASVVIWWSVFTFITGFSMSVTMLMVCLFLIGMGEAGAFPISNRALSRWMLPSERGFAQGTTHAGSRLAGALTASAGAASTFGRAEVVAGSARCFGKTGEGCTTSTSIAGGALLPGPGSVISIGSMAATQSPCTAPAPSTQSGRVIERLSVKGRSFRGAAALPPPTSASS